MKPSVPFRLPKYLSTMVQQPMLLVQGETWKRKWTATLTCLLSKMMIRMRKLFKIDIRFQTVKVIEAMNLKMLKKGPPQLLFESLLLKLFLLFDVPLASVSHLFGMGLICCRKHSSHKRYQCHSNQPPHQTPLTSGSQASAENMTVWKRMTLGNWSNAQIGAIMALHLEPTNAVYVPHWKYILRCSILCTARQITIQFH